MSNNKQQKIHDYAVIAGTLAAAIYFCLTIIGGSTILYIMRVLFAGIATAGFGVGMYLATLENTEVGPCSCGFAVSILCIIISLEKLMESIG